MMESKDEDILSLKVEHGWRTGKIDITETKPGEEIVSPTFYIGSSKNLRARFLLYPRGLDPVDSLSESMAAEKYASLYLQFESETLEEFKAVLTFSLLNLIDGQELTKFHCAGTFVQSKSLGCKKFVPEKLMDSANSSKGLIVLCKIDLVVDSKPREIEDKDDSRKNLGSKEGKPVIGKEASEKNSGILVTINLDSLRIKQLLDNYKKIPQYHEPNVVSVMCKGLKFYANKNIIAAHSTILDDMLFNIGASKITSNSLELNDLKPEVVKEILRFMYTGTIKDWKIITGLLEAANKYKLEKLKNFCEDKLFDQMSLDNVFDILILADHFRINRLKRQALEIIILYAKWAIEKPGFQIFIKSDKTHLIQETFKALACVNNGLLDSCPNKLSWIV